MKIRLLMLCGIALCTALLPHNAMAQIAVRDVIRHMLPNKRPILNADVMNNSKEKILGTMVDIKESFRNPDGTETAKVSDDFVVAPKTMILRPGERRNARLLLKRPADIDKERYYRISFNPTQPTADELRAAGIPAPSDNISASVGLISGMGMFITVAPRNIQPKLTWTRDATAITFKNEGNTSIDMRLNTKYCAENDKSKCFELPFKRIYPGQSWKFDVAGNLAIKYFYQVYDDYYAAQIAAMGE